LRGDSSEAPQGPVWNHAERGLELLEGTWRGGETGPTWLIFLARMECFMGSGRENLKAHPKILA